MDNDILHKTTAYGLLDNVLDVAIAHKEIYGILGAAKYIVPKKLKKHLKVRDYETVMVEFNTSINKLEILEPSEEEVALAAHFEFEAQRLNLEFDNGESQLCAILLFRKLRRILTGDKRAINAAESLLNNNHISNEISFKLVCLEQVIQWLINEYGITLIRSGVCEEKSLDRAMSNCFSCSSPETTVESCLGGLESYIMDLRKSAPTTLAPDFSF